MHYDSSADSFARQLVQCQKFVLEALESIAKPLQLDTHGQVFHVLTLIEGEANLTVGKQCVTLGQFQSVLIPANCGAYQVSGEFRALKAHAM